MKVTYCCNCFIDTNFLSLAGLCAGQQLKQQVDWDVDQEDIDSLMEEWKPDIEEIARDQ